MNWLFKLIDDWRQYRITILNLKNEHRLEMRVCHSCETLKAQLEAQNQLIRELTKPLEQVSEIKQSVPQPIHNHKPWRVRRAQLESADRKRAEELIKNKEAEITADSLESELEAIQNAEQSA